MLTGWNVLDFDFKVLAERFTALGIPFDIGRVSDELARISASRRTARSVLTVPSAAGHRPWLARSSGEFRLALRPFWVWTPWPKTVLGQGKTVTSRGEDKMAELERLRAEDPRFFLPLLSPGLATGYRYSPEKTGFDKLTVKRAAFTGVGLDLAWTSIPTFERIYGIELSRRNIVEPERDPAACCPPRRAVWCSSPCPVCSTTFSSWISKVCTRHLSGPST